MVRDNRIEWRFEVLCKGLRLRDYRITVLISRCAAAEEHEWFVASIPDFVSPSRGDCNGIAWPDFLRILLDLHFPDSGLDEIDLLRARVVMFLCAPACGNSSFSQALIPNDRVPVRKQFPNFGTIFGRERGGVG